MLLAWHFSRKKSDLIDVMLSLKESISQEKFLFHLTEDFLSRPSPRDYRNPDRACGNDTAICGSSLSFSSQSISAICAISQEVYG
jgi:hypothetical protein